MGRFFSDFHPLFMRFEIQFIDNLMCRLIVFDAVTPLVSWLDFCRCFSITSNANAIIHSHYALSTLQWHAGMFNYLLLCQFDQQLILWVRANMCSMETMTINASCFSAWQTSRIYIALWLLYDSNNYSPAYSVESITICLNHFGHH